MLILSRKLNESIVIDGRITIKVMRVDGDVIKLGIDAPHDVPVHREEVYLEIRASNHAAATRHPGPVPKLSPNRIAPSATQTKKTVGRIAGSNPTGNVALETKTTQT